MSRLLRHLPMVLIVFSEGVYAAGGKFSVIDQKNCRYWDLEITNQMDAETYNILPSKKKKELDYFYKNRPAAGQYHLFGGYTYSKGVSLWAFGLCRLAETEITCAGGSDFPLAKGTYIAKKKFAPRAFTCTKNCEGAIEKFYDDGWEDETIAPGKMKELRKAKRTCGENGNDWGS